jgi:hypothetical protein
MIQVEHRTHVSGALYGTVGCRDIGVFPLHSDVRRADVTAPVDCRGNRILAYDPLRLGQGAAEPKPRLTEIPDNNMDIGAVM